MLLEIGGRVWSRGMERAGTNLEPLKRAAQLTLSLTTSLLVRVLQRNRTSSVWRWGVGVAGVGEGRLGKRERLIEIYFRKLAFEIGGASKSEICRAGWKFK